MRRRAFLYGSLGALGACSGPGADAPRASSSETQQISDGSYSRIRQT